MPKQKYVVKEDSKSKPFQGDGGEMVPWFYTKLLRVSDGVSIEAGGKMGFKKDEEVVLEIEKIEKDNGGFRYKILSSAF